MIEFQRIVPVINPAASNIERAQGYLRDLCDAFPDYYDRSATIMTTRNAEETQERIANTTRDGDLVPILGGDGTIGVAAKGIEGRDITALMTWAGNGNDGSRDLNGEAGARPIHELIKEGTSVAIHPIDITIDALKLQAINYFAIGANPKGAKLLNTDGWRNLPGYHNDRVRAAYEWVALPPVGLFSRRFPITEDGQTRHAVDLTVANARYMAKHAKPPVSLAEARAFMVECATAPELLPWAVRAITGNLRGSYLEKGQTRCMKIGRTVLYHTDAEPDYIEKGSEVTLAISDVPFYAVSTTNPPSHNEGLR